LKTIGVLGGLGPAASCYFYELLTRLCPARQDQDHPDVLLYSKASVPDRSSYLLGRSNESPLPALLEGIALLERAGAQVIALPCATAHHFHPELQASASVPVLNMLALTARSLQAVGVTKTALLATEGTYASGAFREALEEAGITALMPRRDGVATLMDLIYEIKAGRMPQAQLLKAVAAPLMQQGAQRVILGCTELSLFVRGGLDDSYIDPMRILALETLQV
jgi:aspartate racemase